MRRGESKRKRKGYEDQVQGRKKRKRREDEGRREGNTTYLRVINMSTGEGLVHTPHLKLLQTNGALLVVLVPSFLPFLQLRLVP
jgi:hypothetical protein